MPSGPPSGSRCQRGYLPAHGSLLGWEIHSQDRLAIVTIDGELDAYTAPSLDGSLSPLVETGNHLILDIERVSFCAVAGLSLFLRLHHRAEATDGSLHLATPSHELRRVIGLIQLQDVLVTAPDVTSVVTTLRRQAIAVPTADAS